MASLPMSKRCAIFALSSDGGFGNKNDLPWRFPQELKWFAKVTTPHPIIMGRRTWESIPPSRRPLKGRQNIVVSSRKGPEETERVSWVKSLEEAYELTKDQTSFVIGGKSLIEEFLKREDSDGVYLTRIEGVFPCDVYLEIGSLRDGRPVESGVFRNQKDGSSYEVRMIYYALN